MRSLVTALTVVSFMQGASKSQDFFLLAAFSENIRGMQVMLDKNPKLLHRKTIDGYYPLSLTRSAKVAEFFIMRGAAVNAINSEEKTALEWVMLEPGCHNVSELVHLLLRHKAIPGAPKKKG